VRKTLKQLKAKSLFEKVGEIKDPRMERKKLHSLKDILIIAVCATICGADNREEIAEFGVSKREWFASLLSNKIKTLRKVSCDGIPFFNSKVKKGADYVISLKENQGNLHRDIKDYLDWAERIGFKEIKYDYHKTLEKGHGRIEERRCWVTAEIGWLEQKAIGKT
jgi:predicted transposase YbfD/YdcC